MLYFMYSLNEPVSSVLNQKKTPKLIENLLESSQKKSKNLEEEMGKGPG